MRDKTCKIPGCSRTDIGGYGMCNKHYLHNKRYGTPYASADMSGLKNRYPKEYNSYRSMKNRCLCKTDKNYPRWGGKGITICDRWLEKPNGFKNFIEDMGRRLEGTTLDRVDNGKGYSPDNCRWATPYEQMANTSRLSGSIPGVHYIKARDRWEANIKVGSKRLTKSLPTKEAAIAQRREWEKEFL